MAARPRRDHIAGTGRVLGVDLGDVRTGLSVTDPGQVIASSLDFLPSEGLDAVALGAAVVEQALDHQACGVVIGLPRTLDGGEGPPARRARAVARAIEAAGVAVELVDERFSTTEAERRMIEAGMRRRERRQRIDGVAATIILQNWLEQRRSGGR